MGWSRYRRWAVYNTGDWVIYPRRGIMNKMLELSHIHSCTHARTHTQPVHQQHYTGDLLPEPGLPCSNKFHLRQHWILCLWSVRAAKHIVSAPDHILPYQAEEAREVLIYLHLHPSHHQGPSGKGWWPPHSPWWLCGISLWPWGTESGKRTQETRKSYAGDSPTIAHITPILL